MLAYIGPGAGFAFFSTVFLLILSGIIALATILILPFKWVRRAFQAVIPFKGLRWTVYGLIGLTVMGGIGWSLNEYFQESAEPRFIVLGMDGADPDIIRRMIERGELPNFARLKARGTLRSMRVPNPPISPTSWASFITGSNPGRHGIFGFVGRNPATYAPRLFTTLKPAKTFLGLPDELNLPGSYTIPLFPDQFVNQRRGRAFWKVTSGAGIRTNVIKVPVTFPPESVSGKMLSGLGTPDLKGTQGVYTYWAEKTSGESEKGGDVNHIFFKDRRARSEIVGPDNVLRDRSVPMKLPVRFKQTDTGIYIDIDGRNQFFLEEKDWSRWKKIVFEMGIGMSVSGIVRFHLNSIDPFGLYMTPIQINPGDPVMRISHPDNYSAQLAKRMGYFYTVGMPQDDQALKDEVISDTTFLEQSYQGLKERRRILGLELRRERNGLLVAVFDTSDRIQHLMWRHRDRKHPLHDPGVARTLETAIPDIYRKMDRILGEVLDSVDRSVPIMLVSDHGFVSFRRQFDVNTWLKKQGYLMIRGNVSGKTPRFFGAGREPSPVDWLRTRAYQMGLTGIYLNLKNREGKGVVPRKRRWELAREIKSKLEAVMDSKTGRRVFDRVYLSKNIYKGLRWKKGPDLILGYNRGYRTAWSSARGQVREGPVLTNNTNKWSGDHIVAAPQVRGTLLTSFPVHKENPAIIDLAPTVYEYYDLEPPDIVDGKSLGKWK